MALGLPRSATQPLQTTSRPAIQYLVFLKNWDAKLSTTWQYKYFSKLALLPHNIWALQNIDLILKATYLLQ